LSGLAVAFDTGNPSFSCFGPVNTLESGSAVLSDSVAAILGLCAETEVALRVIQGVSVDMVNDAIFGGI